MKSKSLVSSGNIKNPPSRFLDFGFWDEALLIETDPPGEAPTTPTQPTQPPTQPTQAPTQPTAPTEPTDVKATVADALKDFFATFKPVVEVPTQPKEPAQPKEPTQAPTQPEDGLSGFKTMLRDLMIETKGVPDYLVPLVPEDPLKAKEFLSSEAYTKLKGQLDSVSKPTGTTETPKADSTPDAQRQTPEDKKPKTFGEIDNAFMADLLKDL
jgi:hypothetical protein